MKVFQAIAAELAAADVRHLFAYMSRDTCKLVAEASVLGIAVSHTRNEHGAVGMADGYWRASGRLGVAVLGQGGGLTNAINPILTASRGRSGTVIFIGEASGAARPGPAAAKLMLKYIDQRGLLDHLGVLQMAIDSPATAAADMRACLRFAQDTGSTVVVTLPEDVFESAAGEAPATARMPDVARPALADGDRDDILDLLTDPAFAARPLILAGRGAVKAGARDDLIRLAEASGALLGTTVMANGLFAGVPGALGIVGTFATPLAADLLRTCDLVVAFGASLNYHTTFMGQILGKSRMIQIDSAAEALGRFQPADMQVQADARLAAAALSDALAARGHRATGYRTGETLRDLAGFDRSTTFKDRSREGAVDLRSAMADLNRLLPRDRTVVVDGGNFMEAAITHLAVPDAHGFNWPNEYGAVGQSLGNAMGAAYARPDRLTVLCIGDGGLMMVLGDLDTAVRDRLPMLVLVCNDSALGAELHYLIEAGYDGTDARHVNPSFAALAEGLGIRHTATVTRLSDLPAIAEQARDLDGPMLVDLRTTDEPADFLAFQYALYRKLGTGGEQLVKGR